VGVDGEWPQGLANTDAAEIGFYRICIEIEAPHLRGRNSTQASFGRVVDELRYIRVNLSHHPIHQYTYPDMNNYQKPVEKE